MYIVQLGQRAYLSLNGKLSQLTRDQTIGQDLVDKGVLPPERTDRSPFKNVLSSAVGGDEALPEVIRLNMTAAARCDALQRRSYEALARRRNRRGPAQRGIIGVTTPRRCSIWRFSRGGATTSR